MIQLLLDGIYKDIALFHVRMNFSRELKAGGRFQLSKLVELFRVVGLIYLARFTYKPEVLYYPVASPDLLPVMRDIFVLCLTRWLFRSTVFHFHAGGLCEYSFSLNSVLKKLFRCAYMRPDLIIRTADSAAPDGPSLNCIQQIVIHNGVPDCAREKISRVTSCDTRISILFVALLDEEKGVVVAVEAVQKLLEKGVNVDLTCIGEWRSPELYTKVESIIDPKFRAKFSFPGVLTGDAKWDYYRKAHIFLFPSYFRAETFGLVLVEAMCFSLPVVATRWSGIPEVVEDGSSAILCEPRDVISCHDALLKLVQSPSLRDKMGRNGRERYLHKFTIETHRLAMENALSQLRKQV